MDEKLDQSLQKDLTCNQRSLPMSSELASSRMDTHLSTTEHEQKTVMIQFVKKEVKYFQSMTAEVLVRYI